MQDFFFHHTIIIIDILCFSSNAGDIYKSYWFVYENSTFYLIDDTNIKGFISLISLQNFIKSNCVFRNTYHTEFNSSLSN